MTDRSPFRGVPSFLGLLGLGVGAHVAGDYDAALTFFSASMGVLWMMAQ